MRPIITIYSGGAAKLTKKFSGYIEAAYWVGIEHAEGDFESVKVRQSVESYDADVAALTEFTSLMVKAQLNFAVEFFSEPPAAGDEPGDEPGPEEPREGGEKKEGGELGGSGFEAELDKLKEDFRAGRLNKKQYETKRDGVVKRWRQDIDKGLSLGEKRPEE